MIEDGQPGSGSMVNSPYLDVAGVAAYLRVTIHAVWAWRRRGMLPPAYKFGSRVLWQVDEIKRWAEDFREKGDCRRRVRIQSAKDSFHVRR